MKDLVSDIQMQSKEENEKLLLGGVQFLILANDVLCGKVVDFLSLLSKMPSVYRQTVKRNAHILKLTCSQYTTTLRRQMGYDDALFDRILDSAQNMEDKIKVSLQQTYYSIYNEMGKKMKEYDSDAISIVSHIIVLDLLARIINQTYKKVEIFARKQKKGIYVLSSNHIYFNIRRIHESIFAHYRLSQDYVINTEMLNGIKIIIKQMLQENKIDK